MFNRNCFLIVLQPNLEYELISRHERAQFSESLGVLDQREAGELGEPEEVVRKTLSR